MTDSRPIEYRALPRHALHQIKDLWQQLNAHHLHKSVYCKRHFASFTFEERMAALDEKDSVSVFCAVTNGRIIGYCLCSVQRGTGEIDFLFIAEEARGAGIGGRLVEMATSWLEESGAEKLLVRVSHGNEEALPFYAKYGFHPRLIVLAREAVPPRRIQNG